MNVGIGMAPVTVGTCPSVLGGLFQILFLHDLLAFDHAAAAVGAFILSLFPGGAAAGAVLVILDLGPYDLLFHRRRRRAEAQTLRNPAYEPDQEHDRENAEKSDEDQKAQDHVDIDLTVCISFSTAVIVSFPHLPFRHKPERIIGIGNGDGVFFSGTHGRRKDKIIMILDTLRLPGPCLVRIPANSQILDLNAVEPGRRKEENGFSFHEPVDLVHMILDKGELKADGLSLIIVAVQIDMQGGPMILNTADRIGKSLDIGMIAVGNAYIHPFQGTIFHIIQDSPVNVIVHLQGSIFHHIYRNDEMLDLIGGTGRPDIHNKGQDQGQSYGNDDQQDKKMLTDCLSLIILTHQQYLLRGHSPVSMAE